MGLSEEGLELKNLCESMSKGVAKAVLSMAGDPTSGRVLLMGADGTPTKSIDKVAEDTAISYLNGYRKGFLLLSEEIGELQIKENPDYFVYLDPLDGTFNAIFGIPLFSISIFIRSKDISLAYVYDLSHGVSYYAERGRGAYSNSNGHIIELKSSSNKDLQQYSISAYTKRPNTARIVPLGDVVRRIRTLGSTSLEMCYLASGKLDAFIDLRGAMRVVDVAAGIMIVQEAGGVVTDLRGEPLRINSDMWQRTDLIASNGRRHLEILKIIGGA